MGWHMGASMGWWMVFGGFLWIAFWGTVIYLIVSAIRRPRAEAASVGNPQRLRTRPGCTAGSQVRPWRHGNT
jgi:hypothetical protein